MSEQLSLTGEQVNRTTIPAITAATHQKQKQDQPKATTTISHPEPAYNTEYLVELIQRDRHIFDMRCWPKGITKQEFFRRWNKDFHSPITEPDSEGYWWNSGHFAYAVDRAKENGAADPETIWQAVEQNKERHLRDFADGWKRSAEWQLKSSQEYRLKGDIKYAKRWLEYAQKAWECRNQCLKELGLHEEPLPERFKDHEVLGFLKESIAEDD